MFCTLVIVALLGFIVWQNFPGAKAWIQTVIAKAKGTPPAPPAPPAPPTA